MGSRSDADPRRLGPAGLVPRPRSQQCCPETAFTRNQDGTKMELADCSCIPDSLLGISNDLASAEALFDEQIDPAAQAVNTCQGYYDCWRSFVSYAFLHYVLEQVLPATQRLVKAYLWNMLQCWYKLATVTSHIYAVIDSHQAQAVPFPFSSLGVKLFIDSFECICGVPLKEALAHTLCQLRDIAIVAVGALCALQVEEITGLYVCDALFYHDCIGTLALCVKKRKNDQKQAGLWPCIGEAQDPALD
eukprot:466409-Rhodomonas_salina.1